MKKSVSVFFVLVGLIFFSLLVSAGDWPMFRYDTNRTGYDGTGYPTMIGLKNMTNVSTYNAYCSPAVSEGYVYADTNGDLRQYNASNISQVIANFSSGYRTYGSPIVANGYVYFGNKDGTGIEGKFYQLNATNVSQMIASFNPGHATLDSFQSTALPVGDYVYIGNGDGKVYQLNASNVSQEIANYSTYNATLTGKGVLSSPTYYNGFIYIGSYNFGLYQLNATNISQNINNVTLDGEIRTTPVIIEDNLYIASRNGTIYQFNASNISQQFASLYVGGTTHSTPTYRDGYIYIGSANNDVYQLNATNISSIIANFTTGGMVHASPALAGDYLYIGSQDDYLYVLNATNISKEITRINLGGDVYPSVAVSGGYLYVPVFSGNQRFYQFGQVFPPAISIVSPTSNTYTTSTILFNSTCNEAIGSWILNYNGTNATFDSINFSLTLSDGDYNVLVYGNDSYGYWGLNNSISFTIDTSVEEEDSSSSGSVSKSSLGNINSNGFSGSLVYGTRGDFSLNGETHNIYLRGIDRQNKTAKFDIYSTKQSVELKVGESKEIDLNSDGVSDIVLKLNSIDELKIKVNFDLSVIGENIISNDISEEIVEDKTQDEVGSVSEFVEEAKNDYLVWIIVLLILIGIIYWKRKVLSKRIKKYF